MKKQLIIAVIIIAIFGLGAAFYLGKKNVTENNNDVPATALKQYSFDRAGIKFSAPSDMSVNGDDSQKDVFILTVQRGKYPERNYYQLYGILQTTSDPSFDTESVKKDLAEGAKNTTIGGLAAVQGKYKGERDNLVTFIFTNKGLFKLTTTPSSAENEDITNRILDTLAFTFSDDAVIPSPATEAAIEDILAKKYNKPLSEVQVTVQKEGQGFAGGSVLFGRGGLGEGGLWLAVKKGEAWQLVFDGNGSIDCSKMRQEYGFPDTILVPNFCQAQKSTIEKAVRAFAAEKAGVSEDSITVFSTISKDWSDSCLGLGGIAESCLAVITPGYEVIVKVNGAEQTYRTNADGSVIRKEK